jgi:hypothetical protein
LDRVILDWFILDCALGAHIDRLAFRARPARFAGWPA